LSPDSIPRSSVGRLLARPLPLLTALLFLAAPLPHAQDEPPPLPLDDLSRTTESQQMDSLLRVAKAVPDLKIFLELARGAGLEQTLRIQGPLTVFAPTDAAFRDLPSHELDALRRDPPRCRKFLLQHMVRLRYPSNFIVGEMKLPSLGMTLIMLKKDHAGLKVNDRRAVKVDLVAANGTLHVVDRLLAPLPPADQK